METLLGILCFLWILSLLIFAVCMARAPHGFENETGFHYGDDELSKASSKDSRDGKHYNENYLNYSRVK